MTEGAQTSSTVLSVENLVMEYPTAAGAFRAKFGAFSTKRDASSWPGLTRLDPAIHVFASTAIKTWMPGTGRARRFSATGKCSNSKR